MERKRRIRVIVHGDVQGVGFRSFTRRCAALLGIGGWVRNNLDGTVEAELIGTPDKIDGMMSYLRQGPRLSQVDRVEVIREEEIDSTVEGAVQDDFHIG